MVEKREDATSTYYHHHRHLSHPQSLITTTMASKICLHRSRHHHRHARLFSLSLGESKPAEFLADVLVVTERGRVLQLYCTMYCFEGL